MHVRNLIVRVVPYRTIRTCLLLRESAHEPDCEGELFQDPDITARIERVHCWRPPPPRQIWNGCCYVACAGNDDPPPCPVPVLEYPAFDRDTNGRICFYWDRLLYSQPPGRYNAAIRRGDRTLLLAPTIGASNVHRGASKFSNSASVALHFWEIAEFDSEISLAERHRSWRLFQISMQGPFPAGYDAPRSIQLPGQAIPSSTVGPTRRHR
ncbi:hypothetical protein C8K18_10522 [Paraburkholderia sp. GV068]|nr:hypothetical protein C8K19_10522 [Paraburkholderia sp. GV072]PUB05107.1 hypothetical protein C8K18_10522 [Paraburkholderia sp. GV068]